MFWLSQIGLWIGYEQWPYKSIPHIRGGREKEQSQRGKDNMAVDQSASVPVPQAATLLG